MSEGAVEVKIAASAYPEIQAHPEYLRELALCQGSFLRFLRHWWFLDQESGTPRQLGKVLWAGQEEFAATAEQEKKMYALKARKLGFTTIECAYDAYCMRFRGENERVHLFSRRDDAAKELMRAVKYGMTRLPSYMQLPITTNKVNEFAIVAGEFDERMAKAYPADEETAVEATCTHGHVDEWARMGNPEQVWQAIEPSMAGSCHIITTGRGPGNYSAKFWVMSMNGDTPFKPVFISALNRPDRNDAWLEGKRRAMTQQQFRQEYPMKWEDSLYAGEGLIFQGADLDKINQGKGETPPVEGHKYVKCWDVGRHKDAAVCVVFDMKTQPLQVVHYERWRGLTYPDLQRKMEKVHQTYPGITVVEKNAAGEAVMENLDIREKERDGVSTTGSSKPLFLANAERGVESHDIEYDGKEHHQLDTELRTYQLPDTNVIQDSVMAFCIGYSYVIDPSIGDGRRKRSGKMKVFSA